MAITKEEQQIFLQTCERICKQNPLQQGIGTLSEKTVHAVLKNYYEPNPLQQEIPIHTYIADILQDGEIIEIQTRNLGALSNKLTCFLKEYPVTIVHPIVCQKWVSWIEEATGEITSRRKSPKKGTRYDAFYELYKIKPFLTHPNLHICLVLLDVEEYRLLNGWSNNRKRGSTRYDRIPTALVDELYLHTPKDYLSMIPDTLPQTFTVKDYAAAAHIAPRYAGTAIHILRYLDIIKQKGKQGRAYVYEVAPL